MKWYLYPASTCIIYDSVTTRDNGDNRADDNPLESTRCRCVCGREPKLTLRRNCAIEIKIIQEIPYRLS